MKKVKNSIINFIVEKRYYILVIFTILAIFSLFLSTKVTINHDISAYLPESSETKIGKNIMDKNFSSTKESTLNLMFKGLKDEEKDNVKKQIEEITGVKEVLHDDSSEYNKDDYALYLITVDDKEDSKTATNVYNEISTKYQDYEFFTSGNVSEWNKPVLHLWIIAFAIVSAMIILIIMCESYIEPFLFLYSIGLAVFLNMGTNIIFSSVSHITNSIAAILQLALSMDYSIMLMNRYSQERSHEKDKLKCMKVALNHATSSITSSSVTTIVGLLALVFMSFTIGADLGFVLAKGVLLSLISIFLSLPALILLFDKLILKTKKKSLNISMKPIGSFVYRFRYPALVIFLVLFGVSFFLKDGVAILYTGTENDEIASVFSENNQIAIIYKNELESKVADAIKDLDNDNIKQILAVSNTIGGELTYDQVNAKLDDLGLNVNVDDYLLKLLYYNYYNKDENNKMTVNEFVNFVNKEIINNKDLSKNIDSKIKKNIDKLSNFSDKTKINKKRNAEDIANILGVDEALVNDLFILYNAKKVTNKMSIDELISFLEKDVIPNKKYSSMLSTEQKEMLNKVKPFTNKKNINTPYNALTLASMFGLSEKDVKSIMTLYYMNQDNNIKLSLNELYKGVNEITTSTNYLNGVDLSLFNEIKVFIVNENNINNTKLDRNGLKQVFNSINPNIVDSVYTASKLPDQYKFTPNEFIKFVINNLSSYISEPDLNNLKLLSTVIDAVNNNTKFSATEISHIFGIDTNMAFKLYTLIGMNKNLEFKLSPKVFVSVILNNQKLLNGKISSDNIHTLNLLNTVMDSVNNGSKYTAESISIVLGLKTSDMNLIYSLYNSKTTNYKMSLNDLVNFILDDVVKNPSYKKNFDKDTATKLEASKKVMSSSLKKEKLEFSKIYMMLSKLTSSLDEDLVKLVYIYNGSIKHFDESSKLTLEQLVNYLNKDILNDDIFKDFLDTDLKNKIKDADTKMSDAKKLLVSDEYSRVILNTKYNFEGEETFAFIKALKDKLDGEGIYVIGDSPMAYEMSESFNDELDFITVLTMIAIFVVVAITFKSIVIPFILVLVIECAVYLTMSYLSLTNTSVYFISLLIVQSILMGATIDYAIVYTTYYIEIRKKDKNIKAALIESYNKSIHTILCSSSILVIVTLIVGNFASLIAAKICMTLSKGSLCAALLILFILPPILAVCDKLIIKESK